MSVHDAVLEYQAQVVALIEASPNRRAACRRIGIHHSTFYRWRARRHQPVPVRRRRWRDLELDARVVAVALAHPGYGPHRLSFELARMVGVEVSASTVWRILRAHRLNTRALRYQLMNAQRVALPTVVHRVPDRPVGVLHAQRPGDLVQLDCFHVGSFKETRLGRSKTIHGQIWQYTAIDVASSFLWAELHTSRRNPDPARTSALAYRVATDLTTWGHTWQAASTDNGNEYRSHLFRDTLQHLGVDHRFIKAGRPQSNGKVERVQGTLLEELYKPVLSTYVEPSISGLRQDLTDYLTYYNWQRPHTGKWNQGQTPATIINPKTTITP